MRHILLIATMLLALTGCSNVRSFTLSDQFTNEEAEAIRHSAKLWTEATGVPFELHVGKADCGDPGAITRCDKNDPYVLKDLEESGLTINAAMASHNNQSIAIVPEWAPIEYWEPWVLHEFGHTIGLVHVDYGVMRPMNDQRFIDSDTLDDACHLIACEN